MNNRTSAELVNGPLIGNGVGTSAPVPLPSPQVIERIWNAGGWSLIDLVGPDRQIVLDRTATRLRSLVQAEHCGIFRVLPETLGFVHLEGASSPGWTTAGPQRFKLQIGSEPGRGLTGYLMHQGKSVRLSHRELSSPEYQKFLAPQGLPHLRNGQRFSLMAVPLVNRKNRCIGLLKWENKLNPGGQSDAGTEFSVQDLELAELMVQKVVGVVETMAIFETMQGIMEDMQTKRGHTELLSAILCRAVHLLRADRGDFAWLNPQRGGLAYAAWHGETTADLETDSLVPVNSFVRRIFEAPPGNDFTIAKSLPSQEVPYFEVNPRTRSELAVQIKLNGKPVGVLNVESFTAAWFDERDVETLRLVAHQAATAIQMVQAERRLEELVRRTLEHEGEAEEILTPILDAILECLGFDEGILYRGDRKKGRLEVAAWRMLKERAKDRDTWAHKMSTRSMAAYVFRHNHPRLSLNPRADGEVNQKGLEKFGIDGPILGMPLVFRARVVGSLVVWNRYRPFPIQFTEEEFAKQLEPFTRLAAAKIELWEGEMEPEARVAYEWMKSPEEDSLCVFIKDMNSRFTFANRQYIKFLGAKSKDEVLGKDDFDFFLPDLAQKYQDDDRKVLQGKGQVAGVEEKNQLKNSTETKWVRVFKRPIRDKSGKPVGILCIFWDRTKQKRLEQRQEQLLFEEVPHRVTGDLARLKAFFESEIQSKGAHGAKEVSERALKRVLAMWHRLDILYAQNFESGQEVGLRERIPMKEYLGKL